MIKFNIKKRSAPPHRRNRSIFNDLLDTLKVATRLGFLKGNPGRIKYKQTPFKCKYFF
jgi:hypothetical protein